MVLKLSKTRSRDPKTRRPEKEEYYMSIARQIAQRSTCIRRRYGAVIVKEDNIIAAGYLGSPRGTPNCIDLGTCIQEKGRRDDQSSCRGVHAEINAIINAARAGTSVLGGMMYLYGEDKDGNIIYGKPCKLCKRVIVNAGIIEVVMPGEKAFKKYRAEYWVKESQKDPFADALEK
jgi:dCMP deaminase